MEKQQWIKIYLLLKDVSFPGVDLVLQNIYIHWRERGSNDNLVTKSRFNQPRKPPAGFRHPVGTSSNQKSGMETHQLIEG